MTDLDSVENFDTCSTFLGSLFLHTSTDAEYNNITMPPRLGAITGGLYCSGGNNDTTTNLISAVALASIATVPDEASTGRVGFVIVDYPSLSTLSFPDLTTVGSEFVIARNPKLVNIGFDNLKSVTGNVDITGNFEVLQLPALEAVNGDINIQTSSASFVCPLFANVSIVGLYACSVGVNDPQPLAADDYSTNPTPVNPIAASVPSSSTTGSVSSSIASSSSSASTSNAASSNSPSSSATAGSTTKSSASSTRISGIVLWIGFAQILCFF